MLLAAWAVGLWLTRRLVRPITAMAEHLDTIEANVREPGEIVLSAKLLGDMVRRLPTYVLIDRNGDLVARDEQVPDLDAAVEELCAR